MDDIVRSNTTWMHIKSDKNLGSKVKTVNKYMLVIVHSSKCSIIYPLMGKMR